jgi:hypothetical protein
MGPLETIQSGINRWMHETQLHLMGKGITASAAIVAGFIAGTTSMWVVPFMIALGGVGANMFFRLRDQWNYQDEMANKYRGEIADRLGIAPEAVTREHVKLAAYGNEEQGIDGNPILAQALERQRQKSWLVFGTAMLAGLVTFTLLTWSGVGLAGVVGEAVASFAGGVVPLWMVPITNVIGMMGGTIIAAASSLFVQDGLEFLIGNAKGINAPSAHDRILAIENRHARGKSITPEQILQVKLAAYPELEERVLAMTGKHFHTLNADMQTRVLARLDPKGEMKLVANELNKGNIDARELPFILTGQQPIHRSTVDKESEQSSHQAERKQSFAERLGFKPHHEHTERIDESRVVPIESARG